MDADRAFFEEHGWLIVRKAVAPYALAQLQVAFDQHLPPQPEAAPGTIFQTLDVARYDDVFRAWMTTTAGPLLAHLLGCTAIRLLQDTLNVKPAHTGGVVEWHQDFGYMAYLGGARAAAVRLALGPEAADSGCLQVVDGSHAWGLISPLRTLVNSKIVDALPRERAEGHIVSLELEPGDMTVHHTLTFHGSPPNTSARPRKSLIVHAFDAGTKLDRAHVPPAHAIRFPTSAHGELSGPLYPLIAR